ncbi:MAG: sterol desaturase family protein [Bacteroidota bacterium]
MNLSPIVLAIPIFFTLMAVELIYEAIQQRKTYRINDAVTNINAGVLQQLSGTFLSLVKIGLYVLLFEHCALYHLPKNGWTFALAMILWDLCYYWEHRMAHTISLFWGGHVVHHQSEEYNLSVALRQTSTGFIWGIPFFLPMALIGISPEQFVLVGGLNLLYQFWIHTEHIQKLPVWFEAIFNTPSHHRVHHGRDPKYIDKNYGGILIVWDRLFGTFKAEEERPHYGITKPLKSWNPVYANFAHYIDLFGLVRQARTAGDVWKMLFRKPGWLPDYLGGYQAPTSVTDNYQKFNRQSGDLMGIYILSQFVVGLLLNALFFFQQANFSPTLKIAFALWIVLSALLFGLLFERRAGWIKALEVVRLLSIPALLYALQADGLALPFWLVLLATAFVLLSLYGFFGRVLPQQDLPHSVSEP